MFYQKRRNPIAPTLQNGIIGAKPVHFAYIFFEIDPYTLSYAFWGTSSPPLLRTYFMDDPFAEIGRFCENLGRLAEPFSECWVAFRKFLLLFGQVFFALLQTIPTAFTMFSVVFSIFWPFFVNHFFRNICVVTFRKIKKCEIFEIAFARNCVWIAEILKDFENVLLFTSIFR